MSTLIKTASNKLLKNSSGKLLKQNYNFGNCFYNNISNSIYIVSKNSFTSENFSVAHFTLINFSYDYPLFLKSETEGLNISSYLHTGYGHLLRVGATNSTNYLLRFYTKPRGFIFSKSGNDYYLHNTSKSFSKWNYTGTITTGPYRLYLGMRYNYTYGTQKVAHVLTYSRQLTDNEGYYYHNQGLGNEPLSTIDLEIWYKLDQAEILDFSDLQDGSDLRVGVMDFSGNLNHGEITGLPAGTLQEQVDYANANLFTSFL